MDSETTTSQSNLTEKPSTQIEVQTSQTGLEPFPNSSKDQAIQRNVESQLYLHF
jgi:hypothetical protein